jgi:ribonucleoside-diphosphate reductase beta chain
MESTSNTPASSPRDVEPLLDPVNTRYRLFPIQYPDLWQARQDHKKSFWTAEELDLASDLSDWEKLNRDEKHFISTILAFFSISDFIVNENLETDFASRITIPEAQMFYQLQIFMESEHSLTYGLLLETYIKDLKERERLLNGIRTIPTISRKVDWCRRWMHEGDFVQRLVAFSMVEGIFFSGSFCSIFWLKKRGLMSGLVLSNQFISRDEGMHRDFACLLYRRYIRNKLSEDQVIEMLREAVEIEKEFVCECLSVSLIGMNKELMSQYIEYVADHLLLNLIGKTVYNVENPFDWMVMIGLENKTNFFENRPTEYSKVEEQSSITFDDEF